MLKHTSPIWADGEDEAPKKKRSLTAAQLEKIETNKKAAMVLRDKKRKNCTGMKESKSQNYGDEGQREKAHEAATAKGAKVEKPSGGHKSMSRYWAAIALKTKDRDTYQTAAALAIVTKKFFDEPSFSVMHAASNKNKKSSREPRRRGGPHETPP